MTFDINTTFDLNESSIISCCLSITSVVNKLIAIRSKLKGRFDASSKMVAKANDDTFEITNNKVRLVSQINIAITKNNETIVTSRGIV